MANIEVENSKMAKTYPKELVKPIIPLTRPENNELEASNYIDHTYHNKPGDTTSGMYCPMLR